MKVNVSVLFLGKSKMHAPSKRRKFSQIFCSHHFFLIFGHMCSFLSCLMPCDKTFVIFAIKFNSGYTVSLENQPISIVN